MHVEAEETENPELCVKFMREQTIRNALYMQTKKEYEIKAEVSQGLLLPGNHSYEVKIKIGDIELNSGRPKQKSNGYNFWDARFREKVYECPYQSIEDFPDVFVYLCYKGKTLSYWRGPATKFMEIDAEMQWVTLQIDHSVGEIKDPQKSGLISIRLAINDRTDNGDIDWDYVPNWSEDRPEAPSFYNVRAHIFQCKNLPAADTDGSCDPYIMVYSPDEDKKFTQIIHDNNNPIFYESVEFTYPLMGDTLESAPPFILDIIDADSGLFDSDDQVGRAIIQFQEAAYIMDEHVPKPRWHPIKREFKDDEPVMGEILVSFSIIDPGKEFSRTLDQIRLQPETMEYNISINVLGLRNLESVGILPVKKPFIKFYLKSLLPPSKSGVVDNIQTQPHSPGPNPTLSTVIKFKISLPTDPLYCPTLTCGVYDYIFKGISQPMIGNFTIPLGKKLIRDKEQRKVESNETDRIISTISRMIDESEQIREEIEEDQVLESESKNLND